MEATDSLPLGAALLGLFCLFKVFTFLANSLCNGYNLHLRPLLTSSNQLTKYGSWAVVTGASDGIGRSFSKVLASKGLNIVLVARNVDKLNTLATHIKRKYEVQARVISMDMKKRKACEQIDNLISNLDIGILVNNVGMTTELGMNAYPDCDFTSYYDMMTVNAGCATVLSRYLLPMFTARKRGLIVNITSLSGLVPAPFLSFYSGTKAYLSVLTESLQKELKSSGVVVKELAPLLVKSNMTVTNQMMYSSPISITSEKYAEGACRTLNTPLSTTGHWSSDLLIYPLFLLAANLRCEIFYRIFKKALLQKTLRRASITTMNS